jgi:hypothetical protein
MPTVQAMVTRVRNRMRSGSRLVRMNVNHRVTAKTPFGAAWFLVPGGEVGQDVAARVIDMPDVVGGEDSLFPGLDQTYRIVR